MDVAVDAGKIALVALNIDASVIRQSVDVAGLYVSGGAMGAFINHYYTNVQTIVNYSTNTTSLGAGEATRSVLPDLKLILGNAELPAVYTHTIEFRYSSGPELDDANVGILLGGPSQSLHRSQTPIGNYLRRLKARFGQAGAITATARKIATIFYTLVRRQVEFDDSLWQASEAERKQRCEGGLCVARGNRKLDSGPELG